MIGVDIGYTWRAERRNADLNGDLAERVGLAPLGVEVLEPTQRSSPSTPSKSLMVRSRDLSAGTERSGLFRFDRRSRSAFRRSNQHTITT
jgi:hypothetical protein